jgi:hypothetical protein
VLSGYTAWMAALVVVYYRWPAVRTETWGLLGLSGVAAIVAGVALNRPARKTPWLLLAVAQLSFVAGQLSFLVAGLLGTQLPAPATPPCPTCGSCPSTC